MKLIGSVIYFNLGFKLVSKSRFNKREIVKLYRVTKIALLKLHR